MILGFTFYRTMYLFGYTAVPACESNAYKPSNRPHSLFAIVNTLQSIPPYLLRPRVPHNPLCPFCVRRRPKLSKREVLAIEFVQCQVLWDFGLFSHKPVQHRRVHNLEATRTPVAWTLAQETEVFLAIPGVKICVGVESGLQSHGHEEVCGSCARFSFDPTPPAGLMSGYQ